MDAAEIDYEASRPRQLDLSDAQRAALVRALDELLDDPTFKHSRRCSALLRGLVERVLTGNFRGFKERTLGVEIFGRDPGYDTNADPVVRMTATEIRKRLAQFYQQLQRTPSVRIRLVPGSYLPEFDFLVADTPIYNEQGQNSVLEHPPSQVSEPGGPPDGTIASSAQPLSMRADDKPEAKAAVGNHRKVLSVSRRWVLAIVCVVFIAALAAAWFGSDLMRSTQYLVWKPLIGSGATPVICVSDDGRLQKAIEDSSTQAITDIIASRQAPTEISTNSSLFDDVNAAHKVSLWLAEHGTATALRPSSALSLWDFHKTPTVLIGYTDNPWSLILLSQLRFNVVVDSATHSLWIQDQQNPSKRDWMEVQTDNGRTRYDYAVVSRFLNPDTGNWLLAIAGLGPSGTAAAAQLLTDPSLNKLLPSGIRSSRNFEMVIRANIVAGKVSSAQVAAFHSW